MKIEELQNQIEAFEGDKRSKEYKDLKKELELLKNDNKTNESDYEPKLGKKLIDEPYDREIYDWLKSLKGRIKSRNVQKFFDVYNQTFNVNVKRCNCPGKVNRMLIKLIKTYENI